MSTRFPATIHRAVVVGAAIAMLVTGGVASAAATAESAAATRATEQGKVQAIITKGDQEITRRETSLGTLTAKVTGATKLTPADKTTLANEISAERTGLANLKTKLDAETTLAGARADAASIHTDYRVYALIVPKVALVKVADDQQVTEAKLAALAVKLQTRITTNLSAGKNVATMQNLLNDLTNKVAAAQAISGSIETKVVALQPDDYDSDHAVLSGDAAQLRTAHSSIVSAAADAKTIVAGLKTL